MKELEIEYKRDTGLQPYEMLWFVNKNGSEDTRDVYSEDYIKYLEDKIVELRKVNDTILDLHNYKEDFENAQDEIGRLQDQLFDANEEILNLNSQIPLKL